MLSLGGWTYSPAFHGFMKDPAARTRMVDSCVALYNKYSDVFTGFDVDLEFPCLPNDTSCGLNITPTDNDRLYFALWMKEFRQKLASNVPLTIATSAASAKADALDFVELNKYIESYNIMTYDFTSGSWGEKTTGHQTNAYKNPADPMTGRDYSVEGAVKDYIAKGCDAKKIHIGVAFYGRGFTFAPGTAAAPYVPATGGLTVGTWETNVFDYYDIKANYMGANQVNVKWDDVAKAPYVFDSAKGYYISYDDTRSIKAKLGILSQYGLGGVFAWEISGDTADYELLTAMRG